MLSDLLDAGVTEDLDYTVVCFTQRHKCAYKVSSNVITMK